MTVSVETGRCVAVADDDAGFREFVAEALRFDGFDVVELADGAELFDYLAAVHMGRRPRPYLVISDVRMPGFDGLEILDLVRQSGAGTPVVLVTAAGDAPTQDEALRLGAAALVRKPVGLQDLLQVVQRHAGA